jgi:uncharacterized SAM-binding protein YcdF (DUF218 family)
MGKLSEQFLKSVGRYMLVETPLEKADLCIVFGNINHSAELAELAADLYHKNYFDKILVSGGPPNDKGEARQMCDILIAHGVPAAKILTEDKASNTGENVIYSMGLLEEKGMLKNIHSVIAIGHIHASRRFLMTLERHWPQVKKMFTTTNCYNAAKDKWYTDPAFKAAVLGEYAKIPIYKKRGFIKEIKLNAA